jgi:pyruvate/2-oxoacid:ferredoxin oxidoreductase beta subunit
MTEQILTDVKMPFCPGCGHGIIVKSISKSLEKLGYKPNDVIIVSDIGCSGLVDPLFNTHSVHGLHGRAPALGLGVSLGLNNPDKKVIVIQGDGGATIGLQHLLEAARRNIDMTLIVFNNLLYGMTGGQISGLSTDKFKEDRHFEEGIPPFDIVKLSHQAGAMYSARVVSPRNFNPSLKQALETRGFALLEMGSMCTSYAVNKLDELIDYAEDDDALTNERRPLKTEYRATSSLFDRLGKIESNFDSAIQDKVGIVLAGSAGGGVQSAAMLLAKAGVKSGLHATMKGEYPVTVGTGFSVAEVILSRNVINYTGLEKPDAILIVSEDGWNKTRNKITEEMYVLADDKIDVSAFQKVKTFPFVLNAGKRGAALTALSRWITDTNLIERGAMVNAIQEHKHADSLMKAFDTAVE